ncbi:MAG: Rrf2 family transcriptional regulator [Desulfovibrio sp.]|jgi:Rrf2 family protein|nr:Rrf2 family transcriptional regulator [Desulfovibrio sp.]
MGVSLKCQYGLRALFELSRNWEGGLLRIPAIAKTQYIPERFLENILNQLRGGGFVKSRRGRGGGFQLSKPPASITVAEVVRFIDGQIYSLDCEGDPPLHRCELKKRCVFKPLWRNARAALEDVYNSVTLQDLLDQELRGDSPDYCI